MEVLRIEGLPADPLAAAAAFHGEWLARARGLRKGDLLLVFPLADHTHRTWRLAAVQGLAREAVPFRVNAVAGDSSETIVAAERYLAAAPGLTGQYLDLDSAGAGAVIGSAA